MPFFIYSIAEQKTANISLRAEVDMLKSSLEQLKKLNATLLDEHTALKLSFSSLEEKLRGVQVSCRKNRNISCFSYNCNIVCDASVNMIEV